ncbi:MAG TPA: efflux RND transporter periplasmic adaptor subunit [Thermoanaerobaculia bacterium]|nr:efflux RND transporter periplasmic adaptor subunit [Thermoanaerobaculia bacterium]
MDSVLSWFKKALVPLLGLSLALALLPQVKAWRGRAGGAVSTTAPLASSTSALPAADPGRVTAEGRLVTYPGAQVVVATDLAGTLTRLHVAEKDRVKKGALLAELKADDLKAELAEQRAKVAEAEADIRFADVNVARAERLLAAQVGTQDTADRTRSNRDAAHARLATARAAVERLEARLAKSRLTAPIDGTVLERSAQPGEHLAAGTPLLTLADLKRTRIEAEVDEFDTGRVALGATVQVTAEGYDGQSWRGRVEEVPDAVVNRRLKPQDPGRPSDTRVLLVKIALLEPTPLKLGQRVEVAIGKR